MTHACSWGTGDPDGQKNEDKGDMATHSPCLNCDQNRCARHYCGGCGWWLCKQCYECHQLDVCEDKPKQRRERCSYCTCTRPEEAHHVAG